MIAPSLGPPAEDVRKVVDVVGDQDALLTGGEVEQVRIIQTLELRMLVKGEDVVSLLPQAAPDPAT